MSFWRSYSLWISWLSSNKSKFKASYKNKIAKELKKHLARIFEMPQKGRVETFLVFF